MNIKNNQAKKESMNLEIKYQHRTNKGSFLNTDIIAIGLAPREMIAIGVVPMGLVSIGVIAMGL